jgi:hypothetical protein
MALLGFRFGRPPGGPCFAPNATVYVYVYAMLRAKGIERGYEPSLTVSRMAASLAAARPRCAATVPREPPPCPAPDRPQPQPLPRRTKHRNHIPLAFDGMTGAPIGQRHPAFRFTR